MSSCFGELAPLSVHSFLVLGSGGSDTERIGFLTVGCAGEAKNG